MSTAQAKIDKLQQLLGRVQQRRAQPRLRVASEQATPQPAASAAGAPQPAATPPSAEVPVAPAVQPAAPAPQASPAPAAAAEPEPISLPDADEALELEQTGSRRGAVERVTGAQPAQAGSPVEVKSRPVATEAPTFGALVEMSLSLRPKA